MSPEQPPTSLSTRIAASNPQKQEQSPLFASLHPELRNMVFQHALTEYDDPERPYSKHEYYFRPRMESAGKIDTNLLLTCRRIYLETHLAPVALNEHVFWMYRGPPGHFASDPGNYLEWMTPEQRAAVRRMRFVTQLFWLENRRPTVWPAGLLVPKLAITIRHSDWWGWKNNEPLRIEEPRDGWAGWIGSVPGLQELELELETSDVKREQLEERVRVALGWTFPLAGTHVSLVHDGEEPVKSMWLGTSRMRPRNCINGSAPDEDDDDEESEEEEWSGDEEGSDEEDGWDEYYNESPREEEPEDTVESAGALIGVDAGEGTDLQETHLPVQDLVENRASSIQGDYPPRNPDADERVEMAPGSEEEVSSSQHVESTVTENPGPEELQPLELDREARLDLEYPIDLKFHVRKLRFIRERLGLGQ